MGGPHALGLPCRLDTLTDEQQQRPAGRRDRLRRDFGQRVLILHAMANGPGRCGVVRRPERGRRERGTPMPPSVRVARPERPKARERA